VIDGVEVLIEMEKRLEQNKSIDDLIPKEKSAGKDGTKAVVLKVRFCPALDFMLVF